MQLAGILYDRASHHSPHVDSLAKNMAQIALRHISFTTAADNRAGTSSDRHHNPPIDAASSHAVEDAVDVIQAIHAVVGLDLALACELKGLL